MLRLVLSRQATEPLIQYIREKYPLFMAIGAHVLENGAYADPQSLYVGSFIELELPNIVRTYDENSVACDIILSHELSEKVTVQEIFAPFVRAERLYGSIYSLEVNENYETVTLLCPFCGHIQEYAVFRGGFIYPEKCDCNAEVFLDISNGEHLWLSELRDSEREVKVAPKGRYASVSLKEIISPELHEDVARALMLKKGEDYERGLPKSLDSWNFQKQMFPLQETWFPSILRHRRMMRIIEEQKKEAIKQIEIMSNPLDVEYLLREDEEEMKDTPKPEDTEEYPLFDDELPNVPEHYRVCVVFLSHQEKVIELTDSATPLVVRKLRAVFWALKNADVVVEVDGSVADSPQDIVPGKRITLSSKRFKLMDQGVGVPEMVMNLLSPLLYVVEDGSVEVAETYEITIECPFCGERGEYLFSPESEAVYPATCDCGAMLSARKELPMPWAGSEDEEVELANTLLEKSEYTKMDIAAAELMLEGFVVDEVEKGERRWLKIKKVSERKRDLEYPCMSWQEYFTDVYATNVGDCWLLFEMDERPLVI